MSKYIDAHCHLPENYFFKSIRAYMEEWLKKDLKYIISVSQDYCESLRTIELAKQFPTLVIPAIGIHPWKAHKGPDEFDSFKKMFLENRQIKIIGEIGLDRYFIKQKERYALQDKVLTFFFNQAEKRGYRLMLHLKGAEKEIVSRIETSTIPGSHCCIHWFSGTANVLRKLVDIDCFFSCGPALEYSPKHQQVPLMVPLDRILTESDGNVKYRGVTGHPGLIPKVVDLLANLTNNTHEEVTKNVASNFDRFLTG